MKIHSLKILPEHFENVVKGKKSFEVRKKDKQFQEGDLLGLNEFYNDKYTGRCCLVYVDYILDDTAYCADDMIIMAIKPCYVTVSDFPGYLDYSIPVLTDKEFYREVRKNG